jgi:hypothetical protein
MLFDILSGDVEMREWMESGHDPAALRGARSDGRREFLDTFQSVAHYPETRT